MLTIFDQALKDPATVYVSPKNILQDQRLTVMQKSQLLRRWEYDERERAVAEEENMAGGPPSMLAEILQALGQLDVTDNTENSPPTKQGG
ncbi:hypothetical protein [uncultured Desulfuromusa sp.]|uniref:hypothetical protein n=1 Tax=uncultured Desulfuromusa sp. TaxID=219183 RepID=UPI002AA79B9A|nr:hypothetical protein [uncultured Desulfuromusa sp.]